MFLNDGDIVKHFKGKNLIEKNIYEIVSVNPKYTGTKEFTEEPVVVYKSIFQGGISFVREYSDLIQELTAEEKEEYGQDNRVNLLSESELEEIKKPEFVEKKLAYISVKYANAGKVTEKITDTVKSNDIVWKRK